VINAATDLTVGGSADLTHSNFTITKGMTSVTADDFSGRYIRYGVREQWHGGGDERPRRARRLVVPYGGTFLVFADYARGAIRLPALMKAAGDLGAHPRTQSGSARMPHPHSRWSTWRPYAPCRT